MIDLERMFYKCYKKVSIDMPQEEVENRWKGIQNAADRFDDVEKIAGLIRIHLRLSPDEETMNLLISCFSEIDKGFDESNEEEISILAGCVLAHLLQGEYAVFVGLSLLVLAPYYDGFLKELQELVDLRIMELMKEEHRIGEKEELDFEELSSEWADRIINGGIDYQYISEILIEAINSLAHNQRMLYERNQELDRENRIYQEEIQILSWMIGEASDILESPLSKVEKVNGALVLGVELADLVKELPGPYAADAFLRKMLGKCRGKALEIPLTGFIDKQERSVREMIKRKYGDSCEKKNLPILSAINASLTVDGKSEWVPAYRKAWKMDPDKIKKPLDKWAELIYRECLLDLY